MLYCLWSTSVINSYLDPSTQQVSHFTWSNVPNEIFWPSWILKNNVILISKKETMRNNGGGGLSKRKEGAVIKVLVCMVSGVWQTSESNKTGSHAKTVQNLHAASLGDWLLPDSSLFAVWQNGYHVLDMTWVKAYITDSLTWKTLGHIFQKIPPSVITNELMVPPLATADESSTKTHSNRWSIVSELDRIEITGPLCLILFFAVGEIHWDPNTFSLDLSVLKKDKMICRITNYLRIGAESLLHL